MPPRRKKMVTGNRKKRKRQKKRRKVNGRTRPRGYTTAAEQGTSRGTMTTIPRGIKAMWPDVLRTTMVWYHNTANAFTGAFNATTGFDYLLVRGNSVFDPDFTTGSQGQPAGYDDMQAKYATYRVLASSIVVQAYHSTVGNLQFIDPNSEIRGIRSEMVVCADGLQVASTPGNRDARYEGRFKTQGPWKKKMLNSLNPGLGKKTIKLYCSTSNALDIGYSEIQNDTKYAAAVTANPASEWFWSISFIGDTGLFSGALRQCDVKVWVKYYVQFEERILNIPQS